MGTSIKNCSLIHLIPAFFSLLTACSGSTADFSCISESTSFFAFHGAISSDGDELWVSDGTALGTCRIKTFDSLSLFSSGKSVYKKQMYFAASDGIHGEELWVTDGTPKGTSLLKDINTNNSTPKYSPGSFPRNFIVFKNHLYLTAYDEHNNREIWVTNGTSEGTKLLKDINKRNKPWDDYPEFMAIFNDQLVFVANDGIAGRELWVSDGTVSGTKILKDINPAGDGFENGESPNFTVFNGRLYFQATDGTTGNELWVSDGTTEGTLLFKDINPRVGINLGHSYPDMLQVFNNRLFFIANDGVHDFEIWVTDGTAEGTELFVELSTKIYNPIGSAKFTVMNNRMYFSASNDEYGFELWVTDGTKEGTFMLKDINAANGQGSALHYFTVYNNKMYFNADDSINGREPWVTDGTIEGTVLLKNIATNIESTTYPSSEPASFLVFKDKLFFTASEKYTSELWVTDGTESGTEILHTNFNDNGIEAHGLAEGVSYE